MIGDEAGAVEAGEGGVDGADDEMIGPVEVVGKRFSLAEGDVLLAADLGV